MNETRELIRLLAEEGDLDTDGTLEALVAFFRDNDLATEAVTALSDWMDEENVNQELMAWMEGRGLFMQQVNEDTE